MRDYLEILEALRQRSGSTAAYGLDRMRALLASLGNPERRYRSWLIAGSNGKGSVSAMLERAARCAGERTGLNTSPHLMRLTERIRVDGEEIGQAELCRGFEVLERCRADAGVEATFFETITALAFSIFADNQIQRAVVEVGLGGRLDATNLLPCDVSAVVSISLEHTRVLGDTVAAIAREKAHVAREGRPLVLGALPPAAMQAALEVGRDLGARVVRCDAHLVPGPDPRIRHPRGTVRLRPSLQGAFQIQNAAVAALVALEGGLTPAAIEAGIASTRWPGRLEVLPWQGGRTAIVDSAHNVAGAHALGAALVERIGHGYDLLIATSGGRDTGAFVAALAEHIGWPTAVTVCQPEGHRVDPAAEVADRVRRCLPPEVPLEVCPRVVEALQGRGVAPSLLVCGSMYLVGEALAVLDKRPRDPFVCGR